MLQENLILFILLSLFFLLFLASAFFLKKNNRKLMDADLVNLVSKVLDEKNQTQSKDNIDRINETLKPFKTQIKELNEQIVNLKKEQSAAKESFSNEVSKVIEQTNKLSIDADNLTNALKGDSKAQGLWGEQLLEKTLEESGLRKGRDYEVQKGFKNQKGNIVIPDAVIYLPGDRNIIIDSKVSLTAYSNFVNENNEDEKKVYLKEHINSFKGHLKDLASKNYRDIPALNSPDYVLLFVPIESALSLALSNDWDIQRTAMQNQMGFVTPTNLIAILRMAESLWRLDAQNENASMIAKRAGLLIDKFSGLNDDITNIGKYLRLAERSFEGAENKLTSGKGNLFDQIKELEDLGAKSKKIIDQPKNISAKK